MRRFAIIEQYNGNIEYEGVCIEGMYLYKKVGTNILYLNEHNPIWQYVDMVLVWEDEATDEMWIPREDCVKKYSDDGGFVYVNKEDGDKNNESRI